MKKKSFRWFLAAILVLILTAAVLRFSADRIENVQFAPQIFTESNRELPSIDRGFYRSRAFSVRNEPQECPDYEGEAEKPQLEQLQINLRRFSDGEITETGLENIEKLFSSLSSGNRYIVRFVYDWDGRASWTEPTDLDIILTHMRQLAPILQKYRQNIFALQGLFVGNWGEMNGTPYTQPESMCALASELLENTQGMYLSVRTPGQWRTIQEACGEDAVTAKMGLFNDGLTGNATDCGTYSEANMEAELAFQEKLCRSVPNGGEAIRPCVYNDFENAVQHLRTLHITYLNAEYDQAVLDKWAAHTVSEPGCFDGMDGLTYMDRHLGYRYLLDGAGVEYCWLKNSLKVTASVKNVGFAPVYAEKPVTLTLRGSSQTITLTPNGDLREAVGGNESEKPFHLTAELSVPELQDCCYDVYMQIWDPITDSPLELANEQTPEEWGFWLGQLTFAHSRLNEMIT